MKNSSTRYALPKKSVNMGYPRIVYIVTDDITRNNGVIASQVFEQAKYLISSLGAKCLVIGADYDSVAGKKYEALVREEYSIDCRIVSGKSHRIPFLSKYFFSLKAIFSLRKYILKFKPTHFYTRSCITYCALVTLRLLFPEVLHIHDLRGLAYEEAFMRRKKKDLFSAALKTLEKLAVRHADRLVCVSERMGLWIKEECNRQDYAVIPCCTPPTTEQSPTDRVRLRSKFNFAEDDIIICYNGGVSTWQKIDVIVTLFASLAKSDSRFRFLFLTSHTKAMNAEIEKAGLPEDLARVVSCCNSEVFEIMPMCDAGIILRDDILLNNVASPIKIAEYIGCGLPVILSEGIGDYSNLLPKAGIGLLLKNYTTPQCVNIIVEFVNAQNKCDLRSKCFNYHRSHLQWSSYNERFKSIYH